MSADEKNMDLMKTLDDVWNLQGSKYLRRTSCR